MHHQVGSAAHRYAEGGANGQAHALGHQGDHQADSHKDTEAPELVRQAGHPVSDRHEGDVQQDLHRQPGHGQGHVVGCKGVPAIEGLLLDHLNLSGIYIESQTLEAQA